jgi:hypothetical protein
MKLRDSAATKAVCNSASWKGLAPYWIKISSHQSSLVVVGLWRLGSSLQIREPLGGYYHCIDYYCSNWHPIFDIIGVFFQISRSLVQGSIYYLNKG